MISSSTTNLLLNTNIKEHWEAITFSKTTPQWKTSPWGITQAVKCGSKKAGSGTALVFKAPQAKLHEVNCGFAPATEYQTGLVFNYIDPDNYFVFYLNRYSSAYKGYWLVIARVKEGDFDNLCRERYTDTPTEQVALRIREAEPGLEFYFNGEAVFTMENEELGGLMGLYTQQNSDAQFHILSMQEATIEVPAIESPESLMEEVHPEPMPDDLPESGPAHPDLFEEASIITGVPQPHEDPTIAFMKLRPPASKTQVEFAEVFNVPLDSFYNSLNELVHAEKPENKMTRGAKTQLLDQRPRRWYKELRDLELTHKELEKRLALKVGLRDKAEEAIADALDETPVDYEKMTTLEQTLFDKNVDHRAVLRALEQNQERKAQLIRTLRTNGYAVEDVDSKSDIFKAGYPLAISRPVPKGRGFKGIAVKPEQDYKSDKAWASLEAKLYKALFDTGVIKEEAEANYLEGQKELINIASNSRINGLLTGLNAKHTVLNTTKAELTASKLVKEKELEEWQEDINHLRIKQKEFDVPAKYLRAEDRGRTMQIDADWWSHWHSQVRILRHWVDSHEKTETDTQVLIEQIQAFNKRHRILNLKALNKQVGGDGQYILYIPNPASYGNVERFTYTFVTFKLKRMECFFIDRWIQSSTRLYFDYALGYLSEEFDIGYSWDCGLTRKTRVKIQPFYDHSKRNSISRFFTESIRYCNKHIAKLQGQITGLETKLAKNEEELNLVEAKREQLENDALALERQQFTEYWNDPENENLQDVQYEIIPPDSDPLTDFLVNQSSGDQKQAIKTYFYTPSENGYYNQYGQSLRDFMDNSPQATQPHVALFPVIDSEGLFSNELVKAVRNPARSKSKPHLPLIKFIETYQVEIGWQGYGLSELSHTINLFPGESKELVVEKKTKITSKTEENRTEGEETKQHLTSSFEDNLQNTFSEQDKTAVKAEDKSKASASRSGEHSQQRTSESQSDISAEVSAKAGWGWGSAEASLKASHKRKNTSSTGSKRAFSMAQSSEGLRASDQSKDVLKKNVNNSIRKVANDTSKNNKVEFSSVSSNEFQEDLSNKEIIKLENPNVGRTVNYNFFQIQNHFGTRLKLTDVKIVIDTGQEMIEGTDIQDVRVYELEEFGKIYANSLQSEHDLLVASIIARQVFKHYANFLPGVTSGNGVLQVDQGRTINPELVKVLLFARENNKKWNRDDLLKDLQLALTELKGVPFRFEEKELEEETTLSVNTGAYHMEASVGKIPATETYLETRRDIETEKERALVDEIRKRTENGIFFPELPQGLQSLNMPQEEGTDE